VSQVDAPPEVPGEVRVDGRVDGPCAPADVPITAVLFACSHNAVRSPMAEAMLKRLHGTRIFVDSVGARPGELDGFAVAVMEEIGLDLSRHRPKTFDDMEDTSFDLIVTLSPEAHHRAIELTRTMACDVIYWPTLDPGLIDGSREARLEQYRALRDDLYARVKARFPTAGGPTV